MRKSIMPTLKRLEKKKPIPYKHDNRYAKLYNSIEWINLRSYYYRTHPLCENCLSQGKVTPADEVHHKQFLSTDINREWDLLLDENNLMSLCQDCHHRIHTYAKQNGLKYCDFIKLKTPPL